MTLTLPGADIRGYYQALGIDLPGWAGADASVRCFANPEAHRRGDRDPSCSVNLEHGAWRCHGCGAKGGAFDAATARGYSERAAIDLMVAYRLIEHRPYRSAEGFRGTLHRRVGLHSQPERAVLNATEDDIAAWQSNLASDRQLMGRLARDRGWRSAVIRRLELGVDRGRITIPTRDATGRLVGLLRYQPWRRPGEPKLRAVKGSRRTLLPHPAAEPSPWILLAEGEPDMIAARSRGLPTIAVPGTDCWRPEWAELFNHRTVIIATDADQPGRTLATQIASALAQCANTVVTDLAPDREDGYDLSDWLLARRGVALPEIRRELLRACTSSPGRSRT